jgi:biopolymer transport protein ExbB/TolQ
MKKNTIVIIVLIVMTALMSVYALVQQLEAERQALVADSARQDAIQKMVQHEERVIGLMQELQQAKAKIKELEARCE